MTPESPVLMHAVVSVDGFIADAEDQVGPLFDWYGNGDVPLSADGGFRVSKASAEYTRPLWDGLGVTIMGRHLFDLTDGWDARPPAGEHVVVVSHRPRPEGWHPEADHYHFVTDVPEAVALAKDLAAGRSVAITAGDIGGQAFALGLVDVVAMDVAPVFFGSGKRYFGATEGQRLLEDPEVVVRGDRVLHLQYRVRG
ncbi:dihydrofolate reductase family protein [Streptomyces longispororuber]|uniref:dihydrofolate reductase family protein n=1 Tax=Streptomyces longispororuber TaxID=68230 RepID=UPI00210BD0EB|nr:dihydrofolate reductase [Streptomyces longispororuber]MCQ4212197.1 dihydrofolate reductase [Streptomyces longispororuber]